MTNMIFCRRRVARKLGSFCRMHWKGRAGAGMAGAPGPAHSALVVPADTHWAGVTHQETVDKLRYLSEPVALAAPLPLESLHEHDGRRKELRF